MVCCRGERERRRLGLIDVGRVVRVEACVEPKIRERESEAKCEKAYSGV